VRTYFSRRMRRFAALLAILPAAAGHASATDRAVLDVTVNEALVVPLTAMPDTVVLGNPAIADVTAQPSKRLIVTGKSIGQTNIIVLAPDGRELLNARISVHDVRDDSVSVFAGSGRQIYHCSPWCDKPAAGNAARQPPPAQPKQDAGERPLQAEHESAPPDAAAPPPERQMR
jgi:hypothetical protein